MRSFNAFVAASLICTIVILAGCDDDAAPASQPAALAAANAPDASASAPESSAAEPATNLPDLSKVHDLAGAVDAIKPIMSDTENDFSPGTILLAVWAKDRIQWNALAGIPKTRAPLVFKDSDEQRGKLICTSGMIVEIESNDIPGGKVYIGTLVDMQTITPYRFIALRSTGDLVEQNSARFCGIVGGKLDYDNSGGGVAHAIQLVGMFDLPQNHKPIGAD